MSLYTVVAYGYCKPLPIPFAHDMRYHWMLPVTHLECFTAYGGACCQQFCPSVTRCIYHIPTNRCYSKIITKWRHAIPATKWQKNGARCYELLAELASFHCIFLPRVLLTTVYLLLLTIFACC